VYGRLPVYVVTIIIATLFELASALAPNITALIILRFIAGLMSSAPLSNAGGTLNDIGNPVVRTVAFPLFATCGFVGPTLGPIIGGFLATNPSLGWRWCYYLVAIWNTLAFVVVALFMPETLAPALLKFKAIRLRRLTGNIRWRAKVEDESLKEATVRALKRPFMMLAVEPVVQFFTTYLTSQSTFLHTRIPLTSPSLSRVYRALWELHSLAHDFHRPRNLPKTYRPYLPPHHDRLHPPPGRDVLPLPPISTALYRRAGWETEEGDLEWEGRAGRTARTAYGTLFSQFHRYIRLM